MNLYKLLFPIVSLFMLIPGVFSQKYTLSKDSAVNKLASDHRVYQTERITDKPKIDGKLDDSCWSENGYWFGNFIQQQPDPAKAPSEKSEVKILYDDDNLYIAFRLKDTSKQGFTKTLGRRDDFMNKDIAGVALDTYHDKQTASEFNVTAAGQKVDIQHMGAYKWDTDWNAVWEGKAIVKDSIWTIEMQIPFSQLRFSDEKEQVWGMHIYRYIVRLAEEDQWKLIPMDAPAMVYLFGELRGIKNIPKKRHIELLPFTAVKYNFGENANHDWLSAGLDGKIGLTTNSTLDFSFLPDFGQVEADPSKLNLSSSETFYEEKRPFFLEGKAIMNYDAGDDMMFYSRRIGHAPTYSPDVPAGKEAFSPQSARILNALKYTAKTSNGFSLGVVNGVTLGENALIYDPADSRNMTKVPVEPASNYLIARAKQEFNGGNSWIGLVGTNVLRSMTDPVLKDLLPSSATTGGIDIWHSWKDRKYFLDFSAYFSSLQGTENAIVKVQESPLRYFNRVDADYLQVDPNLTALNGWGSKMATGKQSGNFRYSLLLNWKSPGLELNDAGFQLEADKFYQEVELSYLHPNPTDQFLKQKYTLKQSHANNFNGDILLDMLRFDGELTFKNYWTLMPGFQRAFNMADPREMRGGQMLNYSPHSGMELFLATDASKNLVAAFGGYYYLSDPQTSQVWGSVLNLTAKFKDRFTITSNTKFENQRLMGLYVNTPDKNVVGLINRLTLFTTLRAELFINPELSIQYYGSPYVSAGKYPELFKLKNGMAKTETERFESLDYISQDNDYRYYRLSNSNELFKVDQPDFNFQEFRSNLVLRWEYKAGSTFYLVWSHDQSSYEKVYQQDLLQNLGKFFGSDSRNVVMAKFSYWLPL